MTGAPAVPPPGKPAPAPGSAADCADCLCRTAVERVYRELRGRGLGDAAAFHAAVTVYRHHHPETGPWQAGTTIAAWLDPVAEPM